jgi:hypothetical protein
MVNFWETWKPSSEERDKVCNGEFCPSCKSTKIKCVGAVPDGINLNAAYDCQGCGLQWEGY